jgi:hypothetical protein
MSSRCVGRVNSPNTNVSLRQSVEQRCDVGHRQLLLAFAGTINPSAGSVSVFVPMEHAVLTREVTDAGRT